MTEIILRQYQENTPVHKFYQSQYKNQTFENALQSKKLYLQLQQKEMLMSDALTQMDFFIDPSDPDMDLPNSIHAYQTAERIRYEYPDWKDLQITGLIHDLGKILYTYGEPSWNVVGDTFILGYPFPSSMIYYNDTKLSPDYNNHKFQTTGIYEMHCGLDNIVISYGHDEYLYDVLRGNSDRHNLPERYWRMIRYHSCYPWHSGGAYRELMNDSDFETLNDVILLNKFDLYSKEDIEFELNDNIKEYYQELLSYYFPKVLRF